MEEEEEYCNGESIRRKCTANDVYLISGNRLACSNCGKKLKPYKEGS